MSSSSSKPPAPLFQRLTSFHKLKQVPVMAAAAYYDIVLCCTRELVALPPTTRCHNEIGPLQEGFMCDLPYYNDKKEGQKIEQIFQINIQYRCRVVRLISPEEVVSGKFRVQILL
ncbi:hypothetical protein C1H46_031838 [Malus baccata]|uniref:Uncharacterized protein n=1 Tax=Malus baccata TaxID=106549 RepID=A0A540L856_MALBA|nr:hypothetical protein C1H46_031838 [Malus baccata]